MLEFITFMLVVSTLTAFALALISFPVAVGIGLALLALQFLSRERLAVAQEAGK